MHNDNGIGISFLVLVYIPLCCRPNNFGGQNDVLGYRPMCAFSGHRCLVIISLIVIYVVRFAVFASLVK